MTPLRVQGLEAGGLLGHALQSGGPASPEWRPPTVDEVVSILPQFSISRIIGRGGMGAVYQGEQRDLGRSVAIKLLPAELAADPHFTVRFEREARTLASLQHPGIVAVYETGRTAAGHLYFVMEYVDGTDLQHVMSGAGVDPSQALSLVVQICEALQYAHDKGVIHRDIKPANVLISHEGRAKLADFGLARPVDDSDLTRTHLVMGTLDYMAPEQRRGVADHRADIYALGALLYEMLTGHTPHGIFDPPSRRAAVDVRFDRVVERALQQQPERRYQQASEMREELEKVATAPPAPVRRGRRKITVGLVLGSAAAVLALWLFPLRSQVGDAAASPSSPSKVSVVSSSTSEKEAEAVPASRFPPGRWVKWTDAAPVTEWPPNLKREGDWFRLLGGEPLSVFPAPDRAQNWGVRVTTKHMGQTFRMLARRQPQPAGYEACYMPVINLEYLNLICNRAGFPNTPASSRQLSRKLHGSGIIALGDESTMEIVTVGSRIITKLNGRVVHDVLNSDLPTGGPGVVTLQPFRDLEFINLDGMTESEALRLVGAGSQPAPISSAAATPSEIIPGLFPPADRFPRGQWTDWQTVFQGNPIGYIGEKGGWFVPKVPAVGFAPRGPNLKNWALQVILRPQRGDSSELWMRSAPPPSGGPARTYKLLLDKESYVSLVSASAVPAFRDQPPTVLWTVPDKKPVNSSPPEAIRLQLAAIGKRLMAWVDGEKVADQTADITTGGCTFMAISPFKDLRLINLDELPEAEAIRLLGIRE